jgi:hypothetical protein
LPLSSAAGAAGAYATLAVLDPTAGHDWYWAQSIDAAICLVPGLLVTAAVFVAFIPRLCRYVRPA